MRRYLILVLTVILPAALGAAVQQGVRLLSGSNGQLVLEFVPEHWSIDSVRVDGRFYQSYLFAGAELTGAPGAPQLPARTVVAGIPPAGGFRCAYSPPSMKRAPPRYCRWDGWSATGS